MADAFDLSTPARFELKLTGKPADIITSAIAGGIVLTALKPEHRQFWRGVFGKIVESADAFVDYVRPGPMIVSVYTKNQEASDQFMLDYSSKSMLNRSNEYLSQYPGDDDIGKFESVVMTEHETFETSDDDFDEMKKNATDIISDLFNEEVQKEEKSDITSQFGLLDLKDRFSGLHSQRPFDLESLMTTDSGHRSMASDLRSVTSDQRSVTSDQQSVTSDQPSMTVYMETNTSTRKKLEKTSHLVLLDLKDRIYDLHSQLKSLIYILNLRESQNFESLVTAYSGVTSDQRSVTSDQRSVTSDQQSVISDLLSVTASMATKTSTRKKLGQAATFQNLENFFEAESNLKKWRNRRGDRIVPEFEQNHKFGVTFEVLPQLLQYFVACLKTDQYDKAMEAKNEISSLVQNNINTSAEQVKLFADHLKSKEKYLESILFYSVAGGLYGLGSEVLNKSVEGVESCVGGMFLCASEIFEDENMKRVIQHHVIPLMHEMKESVHNDTHSDLKVRCNMEAWCLYVIACSEYLSDVDPTQTCQQALKLMDDVLGSSANEYYVYGLHLVLLGECINFFAEQTSVAESYYVRAVEAYKEAKDFPNDEVKKGWIKICEENLAAVRKLIKE